MSGSLQGFLASIRGTSPPTNSAIPTISGTAQVGQTLTSSTGSWSGTTPITYTYQWRRGGSNISGATSSSYTCVSADVGASLSCAVTATNSIGSATATSAGTAAVADAPPTNTVLPAIGGSARVANTLTCSTGTWIGSGTITYAYQWRRNGSNISGATSSSYTCVTADLNNVVSCAVTATNSVGSTTVASVNSFTVAEALGEYLVTRAAGSPTVFSWTIPQGVTSISFVAVHGGDSNNFIGAGGGLGYCNNFSVTPGNGIVITMGASSTILEIYPGPYQFALSQAGGSGRANWTGGGNGGYPPLGGSYGGGGGAGGYTGNGGGNNGYGGAGQAGQGGGGGSGGRATVLEPFQYYENEYYFEYYKGSGGGGGVGVYGQGSDGAAGSNYGLGGGGGSGGSSGSSANDMNGGNAGNFGGGPGIRGLSYSYIWDGTDWVPSYYEQGNHGTAGMNAIRIIWPGNTRSFPSTNVGYLT